MPLSTPAIQTEDGSLLRISAMQPAGALTGAELVPIVQNGNNRRTTTTLIAALAAAIPALPFNSVQWNNAGAFGGSAALSWDGVDTLTLNRKLTTGGALDLQILTSGGTQLEVLHRASAVNNVQIQGAATGARPLINVAGSDAARGLDVRTAGAVSHVRFQDSAQSNRDYFVCESGGSLDSFIQTKATGTTPAQVNARAASVNASMTIQLETSDPASYVDIGGSVLSGGRTLRVLVTNEDWLQITPGGAGNHNVALSATGAFTTNVGISIVPGGTGVLTLGNAVNNANDILRIGSSTDHNLNPGQISVTRSGGTVSTGINFANFGNANFLNPVISTAWSRNNTEGSFGATVNTDNLIAITAAGSDGSAFVIGGIVQYQQTAVAAGSITARLRYRSGGTLADQFTVESVNSAANYPALNPNTAGNGVTYAALGTDANIAVGLLSKGTGAVTLNPGSGSTLDVTSGATTVNLFNATATTLNIGGAATTLSLGAATGTASIKNQTITLPNATGMSVGADPGGGNLFRVGGALTVNSATMIATKTAFTDGAGVGAGTITNAPAAGNPTKWIPVDDNGTVRYIPAW